MFFNKALLRDHLLHIRIRIIFLTIAWLSGILIGFYVASGTDHLTIATPNAHYNLASFLLIIALPLVITKLSVRYILPRLLMLLAFADAFVLAYCSYFIQYSFGNAGWLIRWMMMFSDSCMAVILLLFWIRNIDCQSGSRRDLRVLHIVSCLIGCIDYFVVSPFLAKLLLQ